MLLNLRPLVGLRNSNPKKQRKKSLGEHKAGISIPGQTDRKKCVSVYVQFKPDV